MTAEFGTVKVLHAIAYRVDGYHQPGNSETGRVARCHEQLKINQFGPPEINHPHPWRANRA